MKLKQIELDVKLIVAKHGHFVSDVAAELEVKQIAKVIGSKIAKLPDNTPKEFVKKAYEKMLQIIEMSMKDNYNEMRKFEKAVELSKNNYGGQSLRDIAEKQKSGR